MATAKLAADILADAERRLRELVGAAATAGEYDTAERVTRWAREVGILTREAQGDGSPNVPIEIGRGGSNPLPDQGKATSPIAASRGHATRARRSPRRGDYPKFFRQGDNLVKIGWSKKEKDEYQHKAPRNVIDALAAAIAKRAGNGRLFTSDDLMPLRDPTSNEELPAYQTYLALAWFKHTGLVKQHGRRGYTIRHGTQLLDAIAGFWRQLPEGLT